MGGRRLDKKLAENPEMPTRKNVEVVRYLYLRGDPSIVDGILQLVETGGYKTAPEAIRHLLLVGLSATPMEGEARAAINTVRSHMQQYFGQLVWSMMAKVVAEFERAWGTRIVMEHFEVELARARAELGVAQP